MGVQILLVWSYFVHKTLPYILVRTNRCQKLLAKVSGLDIMNQKVSAS